MVFLTKYTRLFMGRNDSSTIDVSAFCGIIGVKV